MYGSLVSALQRTGTEFLSRSCCYNLSSRPPKPLVRCVSTMPLLTVQGNRLIQVLIVSTIVLALFYTVSHSKRLSENSLSDAISDHVKIPDSLKSPSLNFGSRTPPKPQPANATLDFQEIIYLSMPYRTDRQDALSLIAAASGLKLTMMPGVGRDASWHR